MTHYLSSYQPMYACAYVMYHFLKKLYLKEIDILLLTWLGLHFRNQVCKITKLLKNLPPPPISQKRINDTEK